MVKEKLIKLIEELNENQVLYVYTFISKIFGKES